MTIGSERSIRTKSFGHLQRFKRTSQSQSRFYSESKRRRKISMKRQSLIVLVAIGLLTAASASAQHGHDSMKGMDMPMKHPEKMPPKSTLKPAEGASVKIVTPKAGQSFKGDSVPLEFELKKGKRGEHVHAYVDGELAGMFKSQKGTLTGIKPGVHTLELRVVTEDHNTELDATDKVRFTVK
jgi:hypothetical protein